MSFVKSHWVALTLAVLYGLLLAGPFFIAITAPTFNGVLPGLVDDQDFYLSRIQDIRDGYPLSGNTYLAEHKADLPMQFLTPEYFYAKALDLFALPTYMALVLMPLLFGPLLFLITYGILCSLSKRNCALLVTSGLFFCLYFFTFARIVSPQFNFVLWLLAVWSLYRLAAVPTWQNTGITAVLVSLLFYVYPYYWTHIGAALALLFAYYAFTDRVRLWRVFAAGVGALILAIPYMVLVEKTRALATYQESLLRLGFIETHLPSGFVLTSLSLVWLAATAWYLRRSKQALSANILVSSTLVAAGVLALNQHVITGMNMEFSSHYTLQIVFSLAFLAVSIMPPLPRSRIGLSLLIVALVVLGVHTVQKSYTLSSGLSKDPALAESGVIISWIQANTEPGQVIYADEDLARIIPAYTSANVFYARNANISFISDQETIDRTILQNFNTPITRAFVESKEREFFGHHYFNLFAHARVAHHLPDTLIASVAERAAELHKKSFIDAISPYQVDYLITNKKVGTESLFETEHYSIYAYHH